MAVTERIQVYVSPKDKKAIAKAATRHGESSSEFLRRLAKEHLAEENAK